MCVYVSQVPQLLEAPGVAEKIATLDFLADPDLVSAEQSNFFLIVSPAVPASFLMEDA